MTRNQKDVTSTYPEIADALAAQQADDFIIDGEIVAFDGGPDQLLPAAAAARGPPSRAGAARRGAGLLLHLRRALGRRPRCARRCRCASASSCCATCSRSAARCASPSTATPTARRTTREACASGWEGLIAKRADAPYQAGRSRDWLKFKCENGQEFVIGGFTDPQGSRTGFGALLLGYYDPDGQLVYAGKVGTGFNQRTLDSLHAALVELERDRPAVRPRPPAPVRRALGRAAAGRRGGLQRMDHRRAAAPPPVPGPARRQGPGRGGAGDAQGRAAVMTAKSLTAGGIEVELSHTDKVLFPGDEHHQGRPHRVLRGRGRPDAAATCASGRSRWPGTPTASAARAIFQKNVPDYFPDWITRTEVKKQGGVLHHVICDKPATLVYLANQACIELHVFLSQVGPLDHPDQLVFDLDPPGRRPVRRGPAGRAAAAGPARRRARPDHLRQDHRRSRPARLRAAPAAAPDFDAVRGFARQAAARAHRPASGPDHHRAAQGQAHRPGVRWTSCATPTPRRWSPRTWCGARPGAHVATPLDWDEVADRTLTPGRFTLRTVRRRLGDRGRAADPWSGLARHRQGLAKAQARLDQLAGANRGWLRVAHRYGYRDPGNRAKAGRTRAAATDPRRCVAALARGRGGARLPVPTRWWRCGPSIPWCARTPRTRSTRCAWLPAGCAPR